MLSKNLFDHLFKSHPEVVDNFNLGNKIVIASDFREKRNQEEFWGIAFLFSDLDSIQSFFHHSRKLKGKFDIEGQEIKYSNNKAEPVIKSFLNAADTIEGVLFNFIIDSSYTTIYRDSKKIHQLSTKLSKFKFNDFQKLELFSHLVGLIVSQIKSEIHTIKWISDNDNLLNNIARRNTSTEFLFNTINSYLGSNNYRKEFIDPKRDSKDRILADLCNIPDIIVGSTVDILNQFKKEQIDISSTGVKFPSSVKWKAIRHSQWFFSNHKPLKKINVVISFDEKSDRILYDGLTPYNKPPH